VARSQNRPVGLLIGIDEENGNVFRLPRTLDTWLATLTGEWKIAPAIMSRARFGTASCATKCAMTVLLTHWT